MDLGRAVLFAGSALLLISLFLRWYDNGLTGWEVFETLDLVLAALAVGGMVASMRPDLLPPWSGIALPGAALLIVVVQLLNDPPAAANTSPAGGAWLALAGSLLMGAGSALSLSAISVTVHVRERDVRRRVAAVDRRNEDVDAEAAEDLDADAPSGSLFATDLSGAATDADVGMGATGAADEPPRRTGRFRPRGTEEETAATAARPAAAPASATPASGTPASRTPAAPASGTPAPGRPEAADLERTQPLSGLPDDEDGSERT
ncbi:MAG TPA: hypothetical protein VFG42_17655 [Baekduia sp.]|uniref:hypothetical protein n=1 Tax=Baekduia sp. TaxID=2600305 RepID=UPI002D7766D2|nr:hypothetical protein [Baekduia sp.]HET6508623.1 hypothetical protein [Baekduia sp.]